MYTVEGQRERTRGKKDNHTTIFASSILHSSLLKHV